MATFEATTDAMTFANMESTAKTVYVVPRTLSFDMITSGDRIEFDNLGSISIGAIRRYPSLQELLEFEGFDNVVPGAETIEQAMEHLRKAAVWNAKAEDERGVMALRVRSVKRKT